MELAPWIVRRRVAGKAESQTGVDMGNRARCVCACAHSIKSYERHISLARIIWLSSVFVLAAFLSRPAMAEEWSLILNGKAIHLQNPAGSNYNESNWGFGAQYDFAALRGSWVPFAMASWFIDSNENPSYYAGGGMAKRFDFGPQKLGLHADVGVVGFVMQREDFRGDLPFVGVLPVMTIGAGRVAVNMTYIPKTDPKGVEILFFQLKIGLGQPS